MTAALTQAAIDAFVEDALFLADMREIPEVAASRLGVPSMGALEKRLFRYGRPDVWSALVANQPPSPFEAHGCGSLYPPGTHGRRVAT